MVEPQDMTIAILKEIRDELVTTRETLGARIDQTNVRLDQTNARLGAVEGTLVELAEQQRFVVRHLGTLAERDRRIETDVDDLKTRVDALEKQLASR